MTKTRRNHARLYIVGAAFVLMTFVVWARLVEVQVIRRAHYANIAKSQWKITREVPPIRGGIFDRAGRPLALSIRSCSVSVDPHAIENRQSVATVLARHLGMPKRAVLERIRSEKSFVWVRRRCTLSEEAQAEIQKLAGVAIHKEADRLYPFGDVGAKIVGFVGHDNKGMGGIEAAFDERLAGVPGWEQVQRDGNYRSGGYYTYAEKKPMNGEHVVLTIDAHLQEISQIELQRAVDRTKSRNGAIIVMDCSTGDVLALAEFPQPTRSGAVVDSLWTIRSVTCIYEPGSTFKLVTAAALLDKNRVKTYDVFDAENGKARIGRAVISDSHPHGHLTFREGYVYSSNIVMAKACQALEPLEFMKYVRLFGFGSKSGVQLLGESPGFVAPVEEWSDRTQITMAFGQEIAVTPLQMVNAFAAIANQGKLMVPRIVKTIIDDNTGRREPFDPVKVRNVVPGEIARRLRDFCRSVVEEGTGKEAALDLVQVSGKTGTAEKASPSGGYLPNKYVASFVGFAPHDDPAIVCLVMLDEPTYANRFGGVSCAPVFARVVTAMSNSSDLFDDILVENVVDEGRVMEASFKAPNFLRLDKDAAMERGRLLDMNVLCRGAGGEVIAQDPDPGVAMARDEVVRLTLGRTKGAGVVRATPDLRGLPLRMAKRRASEAGFRCDIRGTGFVRSQSPRPGEKSSSGTIRLECRSGVPEQRG